MNIHWYGKGAEALLAGSIVWASDTIKVALLEATYTPAQNADEFWSEVSSHEASGVGYTAGGQTIVNAGINYDSVGLRVQFVGDDVEWDPVTVTARFAVIYKDTGVAGTSALIAYLDAGSNVVVEEALLKVAWSADGVLVAEVAEDV